MKKLFLWLLASMLPALAAMDQMITRAPRQTDSSEITQAGATKVVMDTASKTALSTSELAMLKRLGTSNAMTYAINTVTLTFAARLIALYIQIQSPTNTKTTVADYIFNDEVNIAIAHPELRQNGRYLLAGQTTAAENGLYTRQASGMLTPDTTTTNTFRTNGLGYGLVTSIGNPLYMYFYLPDDATKRLIPLGRNGDGGWSLW